MDCARTHAARLGAGIQGAGSQYFGWISLACEPHQIGFRMAGAITIRSRRYFLPPAAPGCSYPPGSPQRDDCHARGHVAATRIAVRRCSRSISFHGKTPPRPDYGRSVPPEVQDRHLHLSVKSSRNDSPRFSTVSCLSPEGKSTGGPMILACKDTFFVIVQSISSHSYA